MRLKDINGRLVYKKVTPFLVDWDAKCRSKPQFEVKQFFRKYWERYCCYEEFPVYGSRMKVDLLNASKRIAIEYQGKQHNHFNKLFHKNRMNFWMSMQRDVQKAKWLKENNFHFIELMEDDLPKLSPVYIAEKFEVYII